MCPTSRRFGALPVRPPPAWRPVGAGAAAGVGRKSQTLRSRWTP
ncbi:hypothetical protein HMPREF1550_02226, partial [Actinomyces sp. oral taxon 877 str. F0543]